MPESILEMMQKRSSDFILLSDKEAEEKIAASEEKIAALTVENERLKQKLEEMNAVRYLLPLR